MRWKKPKLFPGDRRTFRKFLFFPRCIGGEWRWLEMAIIVQEVHLVGQDFWTSFDWVDVAWGD